MIDLHAIFPAHAAFSGDEADFDAFLKSVPAKWVVYAVADDTGRPIQLLCVKNLRASLKRRLGEEAEQEPTRRVNLRQIVRQVFWQRVDSALEADLVYLRAARQIFPESYQGMVGFRPAWFVHVDPSAEFPRYTKTTDLRPRPGTLVGPVEDKHAAARLIELAEDSFDLCRYFNVLIEAPRGRACAYKEMGRCAAPCDGSVPMSRYREDVTRSLAALVDPEAAITQLNMRMREHAAALEFEKAGRVKALIERIDQFHKGPFRHARDLKDFAYLSLQHGPRLGTVKMFLITPAGAEIVACLTDEPTGPAELLQGILRQAESMPTAATDLAAGEEIAVVAHHLFMPRQKQGVFLHLSEVNERSFARAYRDLMKQKTPEESEGEGVTKELNAL